MVVNRKPSSFLNPDGTKAIASKSLVNQVNTVKIVFDLINEWICVNVIINV